MATAGPVTRLPHPQVLWLALGLGLASAFAITLHVPVFQMLVKRGVIVMWFWNFTDKSWGSVGSLAFLLALVSLLMALVTGALRLSSTATLAAFVVIGTLLQFGFALLEGRGLDGLRDRALRSGHAEFLDVAVHQDNVLHMLRHYEAVVESGELGQFAQSKPPGTLLFYIATDRIANALMPMPHADFDARRIRLATVIALTWPILAALAVVPLYGLCALWLTPAAARLAAGLYLLAPSMELVTLHTDQVLFPLLFTGCLWLSSIALARTLAGRPATAAAAAFGVSVYLATFCQIPLAFAVVPYGLAVMFLLMRGWQRPIAEWLRAVLRLAAAPAASCLITAGLFWALFGYDPVTRYHAAIAYHRAWRGWVPAMRYKGAISNIVEITVWAGPALMTLYLAAVAASARQLMQKRADPAVAGLILGSILIVLYLMFFGNTVAEVARLWIFLIPLFCFSAAWFLNHDRPARSDAVTWLALLSVQCICVYAIKVRMDFY